jgi:hypothetical protein
VLSPLESELVHTQLLDERIYHPTHGVDWNKVIQNDRKDDALTPAFTLDIAHK